MLNSEDKHQWQQDKRRQICRIPQSYPQMHLEPQQALVMHLYLVRPHPLVSSSTKSIGEKYLVADLEEPVEAAEAEAETSSDLESGRTETWKLSLCVPTCLSLMPRRWKLSVKRRKLS
jgi:hypothetical protein